MIKESTNSEVNELHHLMTYKCVEVTCTWSQNFTTSVRTSPVVSEYWHPSLEQFMRESPLFFKILMQVWIWYRFGDSLESNQFISLTISLEEYFAWVQLIPSCHVL